jgi:aarF domain-containing kinase
MPDGMPEDAEALIAPVMEQVMGQIVRGGGLRGFNIGTVTSQLQGVAMSYKMCIPPYFGLVLRAFCVIEGIALKTDENYAIVHECLPYLSRRLFTDNNPRMRKALRQLLYGKKNRIDVERLSKLITAFGSFTTTSTAQVSR